MKTISMLELRLHAEKIIKQVQQGQRLVLTRRGKPVARLEPILQKTVEAEDPFYGLADIAERSARSDATLDNSQIDNILYGE